MAKFSFKDDYTRYWDTDFPEGEQKLYTVGGNTDTSNLECGLIISPAINPEQKKKMRYKFKNYKDFASYILNHKDDFFDLFNYIDGSYEDYDDDTPEFSDEVDKAQNAKELFDVMVKWAEHSIDPIMFVPESNCLLRFLKDVRKF